MNGLSVVSGRSVVMSRNCRSGVGLKSVYWLLSCAITAFDTALQHWPDHELAAERLSTLMRAQRQYARLAERLLRAAGEARDPARQRALWLEVAGLYARELQNLGAAIAALTKLLEGQPHDAAALLELARLLQSDRRTDDAIAAYYAESPRELQELAGRYGVTAFLVNRAAFDPATAADAWAGNFAPYTADVLARVERGRRFALEEAAHRCGAVTEGDVTVVPVACLAMLR